MDGGSAISELAESFESRDDGKRWVFKIRSGVVYSDGSPLKMEDIVFSIMRHKEERVLSTVRQLAGNFKDAKADGPDTIILELHEPDVDIPITLSTFQIGRAHVELQSLMRISYAVFCLKKKIKTRTYK